jgi:hypothetical protein
MLGFGAQSPSSVSGDQYAGNVSTDIAKRYSALSSHETIQSEATLFFAYAEADDTLAAAPLLLLALCS